VVGVRDYGILQERRRVPKQDPLFEDLFELVPALLERVGIRVDALEIGDLPVEAPVVLEDLLLRATKCAPEVHL